MSLDIKIFSVCDHKINEEEVQVSSDLRTIPIPRVTSSSEIRLFINGFEVEQDSPRDGWSIQGDDLSFNYQKSKIILNKKRKSTNDFFLISYSVLPDLCPKCISLRVHNDESYTNLGLISFVQNEEKLIQEVKKGLLTELSSNPFHTWIGTEIHKLIGTKVYNADTVRANLVQEVSVYLDKYLDVQTQQTQYQSVTDREAFFQTLLIDADFDPEDPTIWTLTVIFQNRTGADMVFEKKLELPSQSNFSSRAFNFE
ncbi:hypothetical protein N9948_01360 [bacterium]|nr:hypothetical protein [bacterium]